MAEFPTTHWKFPVDATIILTYRESGSPDRRANLLASLAWLARMPAFDVVVVEQDAFPRLTGGLPHPGCKVLFAYNPGPFNKAWGYNVGARAAASPVLIFADADVIVDGVLAGAVVLCRQNFQVVKPYRRLVDLTPAETALVREGSHDLVPARRADALPNREGSAEVIVLCGGLFLIRVDAFAQLGGWDERFRGWGGEDDALTYRIQRARLSTVELDERPALHLWHPRPVAATSGQPHYRSNCELLARYRRYSDGDLLRLAEVQRQAMGYREKYRPAA